MNIKIKILILILILFLVLCYYWKIQNKPKETFFSKVDLKKKVIVVIMDGIVPSSFYKAISNHACRKLINKCTIIYDKDKISSKKKINVTNDISFKTSSKKKNVTYIILHNNTKSNKYKKKFMKKWCSDKKKEKDNYVIINYDNALMNSHEIFKELSSKLNIKFDITDLIKLKL
jgi:hypothetical protein